MPAEKAVYILNINICTPYLNWDNYPKLIGNLMSLNSVSLSLAPSENTFTFLDFRNEV